MAESAEVFDWNPRQGTVWMPVCPMLTADKWRAGITIRVVLNRVTWTLEYEVLDLTSPFKSSVKLLPQSIDQRSMFYACVALGGLKLGKYDC